MNKRIKIGPLKNYSQQSNLHELKKELDTRLIQRTLQKYVDSIPQEKMELYRNQQILSFKDALLYGKGRIRQK